MKLCEELLGNSSSSVECIQSSGKAFCSLVLGMVRGCGKELIQIGYGNLLDMLLKEQCINKCLQ